MDKLLKVYFFLLACLLIGTACVAQPQHFYYETLNVDKGLSQSTVYNFLQDEKGRMWIGSGDGLNLYDGYEVRTFKAIPGNKHSIPHKIVRALAQDSLGRIWAGTDKGIAIVDLEKDTVITLFGSLQVSYPLFADGDNMVCQVLGAGIKTVNIRSFELSEPPADMASKAYREIKWVEKGSVCLYTSEGKLYCRPKGGEFTVTDIDLGDKKINCIYPFGKQIYIGGEGFMAAFNLQTQQLTYLAATQGKDVRAMYVDHQNRLWLSITGEGIYLLDKNQQLIQKLGPNYMSNGQSQVSLSFVDHFYEDKDGNLWAGTDGSGVCIFPLGSQKFVHYTKETGNPLSLPGNFIKCFFETGDTTWIGTLENGLIVYNRPKGSFSSIPVIGKSGKPSPIAAICQAANQDELLLGGQEGLRLYKNGKVTKLNIPNLPDDAYIHSLAGPYFNRWFVGAREGLFEIHLYYKVWSATQISKTPCPYVFIGTNKQLCALIREKGIITSGAIRGKWATLPFDTATTGVYYNHIIYKPGGNSYITSTTGLIKLDANLQVIKSYGIKDGLPDLMVYGLLEDPKGKLWMGTNRGLSCFDPKTDRFTNYDLEDGIQSKEFNTGALYAGDSLFYFGGINGFNVFDPNALHPESTTNHLLLSEFLLNDMPQENWDLASFKYKENTLSFKVASPSFVGQDKMEYAFFLKGLDDYWYMAGNSRFVRYAALAPGNYQLMAKVKNSVGVWSEPTLVKSFTILKPYWLTWWFMLLCVVAFGLFVAAIVYLVLREKHQKELADLKRQKEMQEIRTRISRDIHDELGADLTKISLKAQVINRKSKSMDAETQTELSKLSENSRGLTKSLGDIVWSVNPSHDNIQSTAAFLYAYFSEMADNASVILETNLGDSFPTTYIHPEKRRSLVLVAKEAFNNLIKHAHAKQARVWLTLTENEVSLLISDNGTGFNVEERKGKRTGLVSMEKRIEGSGGKFTIESIEGQGSTVKMYLPLQTETE